MKILKKNVELDEVLSCYDRENQGAASFVWARNYLSQKSRERGGKWVLAVLDKAEIRDVMLPDHRHPRENPNLLIPKPGMTVSAGAARVKDVTQETGPCWDNIHSHKERDFSQVHIFLRYQNGGFMNLDGLHRLLAWAVFEKTEEIPAYVVGWQGADGL
jgi:Family of unknown function (DUF6309)